MEQPNVVALIADAAYFPGAFVAAARILDLGLRQDASLVILHSPGAVTNEQQRWLASRHARINLREIRDGEFLPGDFGTWVSRLTPLFLRFALPETFASARRILYVDSDILPLRPIDSVFDLDLAGHALAAVPDDLDSGLAGYKPSWIDYREGLGVPIGVPYLNCGVLLMDAAAWRTRRLKQHLIELYLANRDRCRYFDQSAINLFFKGEFALLSPIWNFQQNCQAIRAEKMMAPRLVHFAGSAKPWRNDGFVFAPEYRKRYRETLAGTPFEHFFQSYERIGSKQFREAWRSISRIAAGKEPQSGFKRSEMERLRRRLREHLTRFSFIDGSPLSLPDDGNPIA